MTWTALLIALLVVPAAALAWCVLWGIVMVPFMLIAALVEWSKDRARLRSYKEAR